MNEMRQERGQAIVEFALTALIFLTLLVFVVDGSRIFWNYLAVTEAARGGAHQAIVHGAKSTAEVGPGNHSLLTTRQEHSRGPDRGKTAVEPRTLITQLQQHGRSGTVSVKCEGRSITRAHRGDNGCGRVECRAQAAKASRDNALAKESPRFASAVWRDCTVTVSRTVGGLIAITSGFNGLIAAATVVTGVKT